MRNILIIVDISAQEPLFLKVTIDLLFEKLGPDQAAALGVPRDFLGRMNPANLNPRAVRYSEVILLGCYFLQKEFCFLSSNQNQNQEKKRHHHFHKTVTKAP